MKKKVIIISSITLVFVLAVALIILLVFNKDKDLNIEKEKFDNEIVSILTIEVNPSIEINLNKTNIVVSVVALIINDDSRMWGNKLLSLQGSVEFTSSDLTTDPNRFTNSTVTFSEEFNSPRITT